MVCLQMAPRTQGDIRSYFAGADGQKRQRDACAPKASAHAGDEGIALAHRPVEDFEELPEASAERVAGRTYRYRGGLRQWTGATLSAMCVICTNVLASHPDSHDRPRQLCSQCAKTSGTFKRIDGGGHRLCILCPDGAKLHASQRDAQGYVRLCTACAKSQGTYSTRSPCRDCANNAKLQAHYPDEHGNPRQLCATHAEAAGTKPRATAGSSLVASRCWDAIEKKSGVVLTWSVRHTAGSPARGQEKNGLVPGWQIRPDAFIEPDCPVHLQGETSGDRGAVYLFHGNMFHGYPPDHDKHADISYHGIPFRNLYHKTMEQLELYRAHGYRTFYVWEHEYSLVERHRCPKPVLDVIHELRA